MVLPYLMTPWRRINILFINALNDIIYSTVSTPFAQKRRKPRPPFAISQHCQREPISDEDAYQTAHYILEENNFICKGTRKRAWTHDQIKLMGKDI